MINLYDILGVNPDASEKDIKDAYRKMSKKFHPDYNPDDTFCEEHFKKIQSAYEILSEPVQRKQHDTQQKAYKDWLALSIRANKHNNNTTHRLYLVTFTKKILEVFHGFARTFESTYFIATAKGVTLNHLSTLLHNVIPQKGFVIVEVGNNAIGWKMIPNATVNWIKNIRKSK
jgi:DnaJ-class molecular chaperone